MSPIKFKRHLNQFGSKLKPSALILLLISRSFSSQIPLKIDTLARIGPSVGPFDSFGEVDNTFDKSNQSRTSVICIRKDEE